MSVNIFDLPDALVAHVVQSTAYGQNTQMANRLLGMAKPAVPAANGTLSQEQITLIMTAIDAHFDTATKIARQWEIGDPLTETAAVKDSVVNTLMGFSRFAHHMDSEYGTLIKGAYDKDETVVLSKLQRFKSVLEVLIAENKGAKTTVAAYESSLSAALDAFNSDYKNVLSEVGTVSAAISKLHDKVGSLQDNIADNNAEVLDTFIETAGTEIEQGVVVAGGVASEDPAAVVAAGVQMGVAYVKGLVEVIELNEKTLQDLLEIRKLGLQIGQDEVILMVLTNIGTMLASLGAIKGLQLQIVGDVVDYLTDLDQAIDQLIKTHQGDLAAQIDTTNYNPATVGSHNPAFPPWNVLDPMDRAARVFDKAISLTPTVFDDDTQFAELGANAG